MRTSRWFITATLLLLSFSLTGCSKSRNESATELNNSNPALARQPDTGAAGLANNQPGAAIGRPAANGEVASTQVPAPLIIPAGTPITVRLQQSLSSRSSVPGEHFEAVVEEPVVVDDRTILPVGASVTGHVVIARHSGRLRHPGELGLTLDSVAVGNQQVPLRTSSVIARGGSHKKRNLGWIGGGAGGGALIGALAGGGKGALIGSGIGAVAGTTTAFITGRKDVAFSAERRLRFRLNHEVTLEG